MIAPTIREARIAQEIRNALPQGTFTIPESVTLAQHIIAVAESQPLTVEEKTAQKISDINALIEHQEDLGKFNRTWNKEQVDDLLAEAAKPASEFELRRRLSLAALHATEVAQDKLQAEEALLIAERARVARAMEESATAEQAIAEQTSALTRARAAMAAGIAAMESHHPVAKNMSVLLARIKFIEEENERLKSALLGQALRETPQP